MMASVNAILALLHPWQWALFALALVLLVLLVWLLLRARKARKTGKMPDPKPTLPRRWLHSVMTALRYMTTRQAWRYQHHWVLLLGEEGAGKTSLAASLNAGDREANVLDSHRHKPHQWQHLKGLTTLAEGVVLNKDGVIIDPPGKLPVADADSKEGQQWQQLLDAINDGRPERPLDAVVLTLSVESLLSKNPEQLTALAERLYLQLWRIQKRFEFVLPLYVVITQCDYLPGYSAFWSLVEPARRQEIWGWSNNALNDQETAQLLVDSVIEEVMTSLRQQQIQAAAGHADIDDADAFFLFPRRFLELAGPLRQLLEQLFKPSTFMVNNYLRGIYFTGSLAASRTPENTSTSEVDFVQELFANKVFSERRLARPLRQSIWSRNRIIRNLQYGLIGATLVSAVVLGYQSIKLERQVDHISNTLETVNLVNHLQTNNAGCINQSDIFRVLDSIGDVQASFHSPVIPISFVDSRMLEKASAWLSNRSLSNIVMEGMHCELRRRIDDIKTRPTNTSDKLLTSVTLSTQRDQLLTYLERIQALENAVDAFNYISQTASSGDTDSQVQAFEGLIHYLYDRPVPESVHQVDSIYRSAVTKVSYPKPFNLGKAYKDLVSRNLIDMANDYHQALLDRVQYGADLVTKLQQEQGDIPEEVLALKDWVDWMQVSWLGNDKLHNPCADIARSFEQKLEPLYRNHGYDYSLTKEINQFLPTQCYDKAQAMLGAIRLAPYGNVFLPSDSGYLLNPALRPELAGISALVKLPLMHTPAERSFSCQVATQTWDLGQLAQATTFLGQYQDFATAQQTDTSQKLPLYLRLARQHVSALLETVLSDAQQPPKPGTDDGHSLENQLAVASANFGQAQASLGNLRQQLAAMGDTQGASQLNNCVQSYSSNMLRQLSLLTDNSRLYSPTPSAAESDPQARIYDLGSKSDIKDYLGRQRQRATVLAGYAQPFARYLSQNPATISSTALPANATADYWQGTLAELTAYQKAVPDAAIASLDDFVSKTLASMDYSNCNQLLQGQSALPEGDNLFAGQAQQLATQTQWRCDDRRDADAYAQYRDLATRFNSQLAGRYPFAASGAPDANPATVRAFFSDYLAEKDSLATASAGLNASHWRAIRRFLAQLDAAAAFFGPTLAADNNPPVVLTADFNALPGKAKGAEQLIGWQLVGSGNSISFPGTGNQLAWTPGSAMTLALTWASQSAWRPRVDAQQPSLSVDDATASFTARGTWGLLRLLAEHKPPTGPLVDPLNPSRYFLAFTVPTIDAKNPPGNASAQLFLALSLGVTDSKTQLQTPLTLPSQWPVSAPVYW
ncbi:MAG: type VI secretion protein IcmF/TssM N-terminal domain-containing protein [Pseudomonadota bacterium]|uniref:type VI secretion protein IcmF/TssM N-terminal domain-containing protein n=1 Tax=Gallaecimonas pentaromativorans TaxID=584787 RepID=UPI0009F99218|nr:type VI secretion protein IcmF/TssM N-terminal domain-containing protein [Gallaecimonas pentaromativorans]MED5523372.1 type VI secretion protein IcmF/TssM N-terminal domain-containing protein [Pseudomonadota bacterium]